MKSLPAIAVLAITSGVLNGCSSYSQAFINAEGQVAWCSSSGSGMGGVVLASKSKNQCSEDMKKLGFLEVERAGVIGLKYYSIHPDTIAKVLQVASISPAQRAGILPGDIVIKVDGQSVSSVRDTQVLIFGLDATRIELTVLRGKKELVFKMVRNAYSDVFGTK